MPVTVTCPGCSTAYPVGEDLLGKKIRCKSCQEVFVAAAARVKVGGPAAGPDQRIRAKSPERNGDHPRGPGRKPAPAGNAALKYALFGVGGVVLVLLAVIGWLVTREPETRKSTPPVVRSISGLTGDATAPAETPPAATNEPKDPPKTDDRSVTPSPRPTETPVLTVLPAKMKPETIAECKKRTVYIKTTSGIGQATGSGWLAEKHGDRGIIVTNAHVIDMKERPNPQPQNLRIIFNAGEPNERNFGATILAVDHINDLAVLEIRAKDLPEPYPIVPSADLFDTQPLVVFGFPRGSALAGSDKNPKISVRNTSVSGRKYHELGGVDNIQLEGGVDGGNSGGPIADTAGRLRCVTVAGIGGSQIAYAIPAEYVLKLLHGHVVEFIPGEVVPGGSGMRMPFIAEVIDPMQRVSEVSIEVWAGNRPPRHEDSVRPGGSKPSFASGDGPRSSGKTNYSPRKHPLGESIQVTGEVSLPPRSEGQVYWVQPKYVGKDGKERYGEAVAMQLPDKPIDGRPVSITVKHKTGEERKVLLESRQTIYTSFGGGFGTGYQNYDAELTEKTGLVDNDGTAVIRSVFRGIKFLKDEEADRFSRLNSGIIQKSATGMAFESTVDKRGKVLKSKLDMSAVPMVARRYLTGFNQEVMSLVEYLSLNLPEGEMSPGQNWDTEVTLIFGLGDDSAQNVYLLNRFTYVGMRERGGRKEAIVKLQTKVTKTKKADSDANSGTQTPDNNDDNDYDPLKRKPFWGRGFAAAAIDVETGYVTLARVYSEIEFEIPIEVRPGLVMHRLINNKQVATIRRGLGGKEPPKDDVNSVLPYSLFLMNPLEAYPRPSGVTIAEEPAARKDEMTAETRDKVKKATVVINVERAGQDSSDANGFLVHPSGLVVTTANMVGLVTRDSRPPSKVTVTFESGTPEQREYPGELVSFDIQSNLAVFRVRGDKLPEPLTVGGTGSDDLVQTQTLTVCGYPNLRVISAVRAATLRTSSFVAKREIRPNTPWVQVEGGVAFDNFGGPVFDNQGVVRGVSMFNNPNFSRQIAFCVPGEDVQRMIDGCTVIMTDKFPYFDGPTAKMPIELVVSDPLKQLAKVEVEYWIGKPGKTRPESTKPPKPGPDDQARKSAELAYTAGSGKAAGEISIPEVLTGQVLWLQPKVTNKDGKSLWGPARVARFDGDPVQLVDSMLMPRYKKGSIRSLEFACTEDSRMTALVGGRSYKTMTNARITEGIDATFAKGGGRFIYKYDNVEFDLDIDTWIRSFLRDRDKMTEEDVDQEFRFLILLYNSKLVMEGVRNALVFDRQGKITQSALMDPVFPTVAIHNGRIMKMLQALNLPLPCREMKPGETWEQQTDLVLEAVNKQEPALFSVKYKYLGQRVRQGRTEAVVEVAGDLAYGEGKGTDFRELKTDAPKAQDSSARVMRANAQGGPAGGSGKRRVPLYGKARGLAFIDIETGQILDSRLEVDADVEVNVTDPNTKVEVPSIVGITANMMLKRSSTDR